MMKGGHVSGIVSLVLIFCVLCIAIFSTMTLLTADRERQLSDLSATRMAEYYEADTLAVRTAAALRKGEDVDVQVTYKTVEEGTRISYSIPAGGERFLEVELLLKGEEMEIKRWALVYGGAWKEEEVEVMQLWEGF